MGYSGIARNGARFTVKNWATFCHQNNELAMRLIFNEILIVNNKALSLLD